MSKLETNTIDTISGSTTLTLGGTNATTIAQDSATTITGLKSTGIDDNATSTDITIDSNENVGIGNTVASTINSANGTGNLVVGSGSGTEGITIYSGTTGEGTLQFADASTGSGTYVGQINYSHSSNDMSFGANGSERMRIHNDGELDVNVDNSGTSVRALNILPYDTGAGMYNGVQIATDSLRSSLGLFRQTTSTSSHIKFFNTNGNIGSIKTSGTSTSFNTTSDHRLKENVNYDFDGTTRLKQLRPARFNFIADANTTVDGFIAHEVQSIIPEAVHGTHNETETKQKVVVNSDGHIIGEKIEQEDWEAGKIADEDGNTQYPTDSTWEATKVVPVYQGIDQSKLVPLLVKTIQELEARIATLETKVTTLENA